MIFAVHIADGVLTLPWTVTGLAIGSLLIALSSIRVRDTEIPRIGLFAAAIFVGSQLHIPLGISSVHLLLNGIAGLALGRRAPLAIAVGLALQSLLFAHGGKLAYGINLIVLTVPALITAGIAPCLDQLNNHRIKIILVSIAISLWLALIVITLQIVIWKFKDLSPREWLDDPSPMWIRHPVAWICLGIAGIVAARKVPSRWAIGLLLGGGCATLTVLLNVVAVRFGGLEGIRSAAVITLFAHLPVIAIEAIATAVIRPFIVVASPPAPPSG
jgi:cobalt/nickel transport system permease protein